MNEGWALAGGWLLLVAMLAALAYVLLRERR
jgi:hypothetical protein